MAWLPGFKKRIKWTIDHDDIDSALDWFPARLHLVGWTSPTGHDDPDNEWFEEPYIYDGDTGTYGGTFTYDHYLELTLDSAVDLDTIKIYGHVFDPAPPGPHYDLDVAIDLYYDGDWHNIFDGTIAKETWVEKTNSAGVKSVSKARIKSNEESFRTFVYEFEFKRLCAGVFDEIGANSKRIAITKADGLTELYGEIEKWDDTNEEAELWVSRDGWAISDSTDTAGYLYYDNTHADNDTYIGIKNSTPAQSVWDGNFKAVWHMADGASTSAIYDSTSNNNDGAKKGANEPIEAAGKIHKCQSFDGSNDYIIVSDSAELRITGDLTVEAWLKTDYAAGHHWYNSYVDASPYAGFGLSNNNGKVGFYSNNEGVWRYSASTSHDDAWHAIGVVLDSTTVRFYDNGATDGTGASAAPSSYSGNRGIGAKYTGASTFHGEIDELRLSDIKRSAAWIKASYESERDHLITWGSEEDRKGAAIHHYKLMRES